MHKYQPKMMKIQISPKMPKIRQNMSEKCIFNYALLLSKLADNLGELA